MIYSVFEGNYSAQKSGFWGISEKKRGSFRTFLGKSLVVLQHFAQLGGELTRDLLEGFSEIILRVKVELVGDLLDREIGICQKLHCGVDADIIKV